MKKICIVGLGNMGSAMRELLNAVDGFEVSGFDASEDPNGHLAACDIFILAVKPQSFAEMAQSVSVNLDEKLAISIMAGVSVNQIKSALGVNRVVRVMPNLPLKYGKAVSGWFCSDEVSGEDEIQVRKILEAFGTEIKVNDESKIDSITALSGSGPAYYYYLNRSIRKKAMALGFNQEEARKIVRGTFLGSAALLEKSGESSCDLIEKICSKGGTTEAALKYLDSANTEGIIGAAVEAAKKRAEELKN